MSRCMIKGCEEESVCSVEISFPLESIVGPEKPGSLKVAVCPQHLAQVSEGITTGLTLDPPTPTLDRLVGHLDILGP